MRVYWLSKEHKGYKCFNLITKKFIISRHVSFDETSFLFKSNSDSSSHSHTIQVINSWLPSIIENAATGAGEEQQSSLPFIPLLSNFNLQEATIDIAGQRLKNFDANVDENIEHVVEENIDEIQ